MPPPDRYLSLKSSSVSAELLSELGGLTWNDGDDEVTVEFGGGSGFDGS